MADKKQQLVALQSNFLSVQEGIKKIYTSGGADEITGGLDEYVNDHVSSVVGDDNEEAQEDSSEQQWLDENTLRPL